MMSDFLNIKFKTKTPEVGNIFVCDNSIYTIVRVNLTRGELVKTSNCFNELCRDWPIEKIIKHKNVLIKEV